MLDSYVSASKVEAHFKSLHVINPTNVAHAALSTLPAAAVLSAPVLVAKSSLLNLTSIHMPLSTLGSEMMDVLLCQMLLVAHLMAGE